MTHFVVESLLHNLNSLIQKEFTPFLSFHQDLRKLADLFTTIKGSLEDAEQKQFSDTNINDWLLKINDVAHMMDDLIDECAYEAFGLEYQGVKGDLSNKVQRSCLSSFHLNHVVLGYKMAKKMKRISERLIEIVEEKKKFHLTDTLTKTGMIGWRRNEVIEGRRTTFLFREPGVCGREEDTHKLISYLTIHPYALRNVLSVYPFQEDRFTYLHHISPYNFRDNLRVYLIEGAEGIGKTTFAKLLFHHRSIVNH
ncbi:hypothetical protein VNO80_09940 [Phaseolus coccineus]|uniref:Disease resistance N-terminal domain-containing protein n=1 Tax=Phaseolus coccineus TaxID=3886 RepID=A0AAN9N768_PHACN